MTIKQLVRQAHCIAKGKGWWDFGHTRTKLECIALVMSELGEAVEELRAPIKEVDGIISDGIVIKAGKPEGVVVELADAVIRIADLCGRHGWDLDKALALKMKYNATREHRHGGKRA